MGFTAAVNNVFANYASFGGRAPRSEYWYFVLFSMIAYVVAIVLDNMIGSNLTVEASGEELPWGWCSVFMYCALILPGLSVSIRRLHDHDKSGWFILLLLVPIANIYVAILSMFLRGTNGPNRFGHDPLGSAPVEHAYTATGYSMQPVGQPAEHPPAHPLQPAHPMPVYQQPMQPSPLAPPQPIVSQPNHHTQMPASSATDRFELLEKLGKLRDQGLLTQAEFEVQKAQILR